MIMTLLKNSLLTNNIVLLRSTKMFYSFNLFFTEDIREDTPHAETLFISKGQTNKIMKDTCGGAKSKAGEHSVS